MKRPVDAVGATILLLVSAPIVLAAAVAMRLADAGPVFFTQTRTGRSGRPFRAIKLRTLSAGHRHDPKEVIDDGHPSVSAVGRFLRRTRVDELPQLLNVLRGDMSLIGPRPTLPDQTDRYDAFEKRRLLVRPGLTGLAQVHGNTKIPWFERIKYDVYYVQSCRFTLDAAILLGTVKLLVLGEARCAKPFDQSGLTLATDPVADESDDRSNGGLNEGSNDGPDDGPDDGSNDPPASPPAVLRKDKDTAS